MVIHVVDFIRSTSVFSGLIPLIFYLRVVANSPRQHHFIALLIFFSGLCDILAYFKVFNVVVISNTYSLIQFATLTCFYYEIVYKKRSEPIVLIGIGTFVAVLLWSLLTRNFLENYLTLDIVGIAIIFIHSLAYFFNIPGMIPERYFDSNLFSNIIFNLALLCYSIVAFFTFLVFEEVSKMEDPQMLRLFWSIHNIFNIIKNVGFAFAFYYTGKRKIYMTIEQLERIARKLEEEHN